jgi:hypothetical protein
MKYPLSNCASSKSSLTAPKIMLGVRIMWVHADYRRSKVAHSILDIIRRSFVYGRVLSVDEVSFSELTEDGYRFASFYCNRSSIWTYWATTTNITTQQSLLTVLIYVPSPLSFVPAANNWCSFACIVYISSYPSAFQLIIITHHYLTVKCHWFMKFLPVFMGDCEIKYFTKLTT